MLDVAMPELPSAFTVEVSASVACGHFTKDRALKPATVKAAPAKRTLTPEQLQAARERMAHARAIKAGADEAAS